ncbi:MAG: hypothetical protein IPI23_18540 [Bacteroidetes bacterium]|nr:hypothetical protein [Bacteroidota bacterium]
MEQFSGRIQLARVAGFNLFSFKLMMDGDYLLIIKYLILEFTLIIGS